MNCLANYPTTPGYALVSVPLRGRWIGWANESRLHERICSYCLEPHQIREYHVVERIDQCGFDFWTGSLGVRKPTVSFVEQQARTSVGYCDRPFDDAVLRRFRHLRTLLRDLNNDELTWVCEHCEKAVKAPARDFTPPHDWRSSFSQWEVFTVDGVSCLTGSSRHFVCSGPCAGLFEMSHWRLKASFTPWTSVDVQVSEAEPMEAPACA